MRFENDEIHRQAFIDLGFPPGRMISGSKSGYVRNNPGCEPYFNARVCVIGEGVIWWGDLDLAKDRPMLDSISRKLERKLYILRESDAWDSVTDEQILTRAWAVIG
jgi:hypothetical protein